MKKVDIVPQLSLLERYLISEIIPILLFNIIIVTVVTESIGISFEQFNFLLNKQISFDDLIYLHILKLPEFIIIAVPISILMTTILVYNKLSNTSEIIALQSCGVSLYKLLYPVIKLSVIIGLILFFVNDFIVPATNYKAAITLELLMNITRENLKNDDILYQELVTINEQKISNKNKYLRYLFYAEKMFNRKMINVTLLIADSQGLKAIINSQFAALYDKNKYFCFYDGLKSVINRDGSYGEAIKFEQLIIDLPNISRQFQLDIEKLDDREMNIFQVHQRLLVAQKLGDMSKIIKLRFNLFKRFNIPISCIVFALLGTSIGINLRPRIKYSSFSFTLVIVGSTKIFEAFINALIISENIPMFSILLPNILATAMSFYLLLKKNS
ncbi:YjgP/YjgQ family permease [Cylindrospermopsis raciborskii S07]|uniref:LptF/LptG family permease n=4 Tax=Cylindrospermopsis TaxID=77021 RepID=A0A7H0EZM5_9CYAN|nr:MULTISPECIES: LptF/LptG family permease [Cylindrospermopsis]MBU6345923.1 LptF/LptG family permease [Cyanobacteria bacterium REEB494]OHY31529.1 permease [Cylindrospermopsis raciborskii CS-508]PNK03731.1 YjgP/YjgQ family permease [Cylindrospermopsis raciborskii S07]PNK13343.1 YjgP/YjgQ family permease [Cylindrospermopsis raciborskii S06]QNP29241.1 LptF/LptG family permease [Cylindrospermopsis curvispora GIHE-G1]